VLPRTAFFFANLTSSTLLPRHCLSDGSGKRNVTVQGTVANTLSQCRVYLLGGDQYDGLKRHGPRGMDRQGKWQRWSHYPVGQCRADAFETSLPPHGRVLSHLASVSAIVAR
jgi:hypothetical protein